MITTIPFMLEQTLDRCASKESIFAGNRSLTFSQLHHQGLATAQVLRDLGIKKGDRVGICMDKTLDQVIAIIGILYANSVFVPILPKLKESNIKHIISASGMAALITDSRRAHEVAQYAGDVNLIVGHGRLDGSYPSLPDLRRDITHCTSFFNCIGADNAAIIYTSGSTGRPKGITISHRNLYDGAKIISTYLNTTSEDRIAGILSLDFDYGLNQLWQTIFKGASLYLHQLAFPNDTFSMLSDKRITALPVMPVIITRIFDPRLYVPNDAHDLSELRYVCSTGGPVSQKMIDNLRRAFPGADIFSMYGLTEAFRSTYLPPDQINKRPTSIGKAIPDAEIYVMDDNYNVCPPNVPGELVHRGGCITKGYWNDPEATAQVFRQIPQFPGETVVFSGDIVKTDEEGYLYFVSRNDAMIKTHGYRVSPHEIEDEVCRHPKITAAVAFGAVNPDIGQDIALAYTTIDRKPVSKSLLSRYSKDVLPWYMVPRFFIHIETFPSTGNEGKVDRVTVQADAEKELTQL